MEDLSSLHEVFREKCSSSDSDRVKAVQCWEDAYGVNNAGQPGLDDTSLDSTDSFLDLPDNEPLSVTPGKQDTIPVFLLQDSIMDDETRPPALSIDSL